MRSRPTVWLASVATLAYPFLVYAALGRMEPYWLAAMLVVVALLRAWATGAVIWLVAAGGALVLALASFWAGGWVPLKLYPALVSFIFLAVFAASLVRPPTVIERIARLTEPDLPSAAVAYTRCVTQVWCSFFVLNGLAALATTFWASDEIWTFYNGFVAYLLMGILFAGEWLVRRHVRARIAAGA
jgi:uncharacterized membrane protein